MGLPARRRSGCANIVPAHGSSPLCGSRTAAIFVKQCGNNSTHPPAEVVVEMGTRPRICRNGWAVSLFLTGISSVPVGRAPHRGTRIEAMATACVTADLTSSAESGAYYRWPCSAALQCGSRSAVDSAIPRLHFCAKRRGPGQDSAHLGALLRPVLPFKSLLTEDAPEVA